MTLYRFHGRITVEREESLSHLLYERMSIMYKVELKFDTKKARSGNGKIRCVNRQIRFLSRRI